ncbi:hypothetical protein Hanom_Chr00s045990g01776791 [Helianthus anomalus]
MSLTMEVGKIGRGLMVPMLIANFVVYVIVVGLAAWSIDKYIDGEQNHPRKLSLYKTVCLIVSLTRVAR